MARNKSEVNGETKPLGVLISSALFSEFEHASNEENSRLKSKRSRRYHVEEAIKMYVEKIKNSLVNKAI